MEGFGLRAIERQRRVLLVDDDPGDTLMIREAIETFAPETDLATVGDGVDALRYLRGQDEFADSPRPDLVLLDLNMPRKDGREVLAEVKADTKLRAIPVVVLTTSAAAQDILRSYQLHANAYVTKPTDMDGLTAVVRCIERFFGRIVQAPPYPA
jgi:CheY-like chemotaxis protein